MNNEYTPDELKQFLNNELDGEKAEQIADYLQGLSGESLEEILPDAQFMEGALVEIPGRIQSAMRRKIQRELKGRLNYWQNPLMIAACLVGLLLAGAFLLQLLSGSYAPLTRTGDVDLARKIIINNSGAQKYIHLPDGSGVLLMPKASVRYLNNFLENRFVYMEGKARFDVKHDALRPFTVIANGIGTLDIGTSFWVNNNKNKAEITIRLEEGSIAVKSLENSFPYKNIHLQPGQLIKIFKNEGHYLVSNLQRPNSLPQLRSKTTGLADKAIVTNWTNQAYSFSKSPLRKVFDQLAIRYQVEITADPALLENMEFTGKIMYNDSLNVILEAICKLNHLSFTRKESKIQITQQ